MSNIINLYLFLFSIFLNQLIIAVVLFHCSSCNLYRNSLLMFSRIILLILPVSFFARLMSPVVALFSKFGLWSFNVVKHSSFYRLLGFCQDCFSYWLFFLSCLLMKMKTKVNPLKIVKETSSGSTPFFQRTSPTTFPSFDSKTFSKQP